MKIPPQALDFERAILGQVILSPNRIDDLVCESEEIFYTDSHRIIFEAIREMVATGRKVDMMTLTRFMRDGKTLDKIGGATAITDLVDTVASDANFDYHLSILKQSHAARKLLQVGYEITEKAYNPTDVPELLELINTTSNEILRGISKKKTPTIAEIGDEFIQSMLRRINHPEEIPGIPTGIRALDIHMNGMKRGESIVMAGRPGMGKTDTMLNIAIGASQAGHKVCIISMEMSYRALFSRLVSICAEVLKSDIANASGRAIDGRGGISREVERVIESLKRSGIQIHDLGSCNMLDITRICKKAKSEGCDVVIIDYMGLIRYRTMSGQNTAKALGEVSRDLKLLAKDLDIAIVALHQLSRAVESRGGDKKPMLSDLRDSGEIEENADIVLFLYRAEYYGFETDDEGGDTRNRIEYIFAKFREGATGIAKGFYNASTGKHYQQQLGFPESENRLIIPQGSVPF